MIKKVCKKTNRDRFTGLCKEKNKKKRGQKEIDTKIPYFL